MRREAELRSAFVLVAIFFLAAPGSLIGAAHQATSTVSVIDLVDRYAHGDYSAVAKLSAEPDIGRLFLEFKLRAPSWIGGARDPQAPRRTLVVAALVLEVLQARGDGQWGGSSSAPGPTFFEWACGLLRTQPVPLEAERSWQLAAVALLEGIPSSDSLARHLVHADLRFPHEPRLILAHAVVEELKTWPRLRDFNDVRRLAGAQHLPALLLAATRDESTRAEARVRLGYYELRQDHYDAALAALAQVPPTGDRFVEYLMYLFRGRALERLDRLADAANAYRAAVMTVPNAQSATLALATVLSRENLRDAAAAMVENAITGPPAPLDPWLAYGQGDLRSWPVLVERLRDALRAETVK